jgi:hypothetical protein
MDVAEQVGHWLRSRIGRMIVMGGAMDLIIETSRDSRLHAFA